MKACGNIAPIEIKSERQYPRQLKRWLTLPTTDKDKWIEKERQRWAKYFKLPISDTSPKPFPQPTINTGRALCAVSKFYPEKLPSAFEALYRAFWVEGKTINQPDVISSALSSHGDFAKGEVETVMGKVGDPEVKKALGANSDQAMADGAFGLPWFVAENAKGEKEAFWGVDHLGQVVEFLGLDRGLEPGLRAML